MVETIDEEGRWIEMSHSLVELMRKELKQWLLVRASET